MFSPFVILSKTFLFDSQTAKTFGILGRSPVHTIPTIADNVL